MLKKTGQWVRDYAAARRGPLLVAPAIAVLFVMYIFPLLWSFGLSFYHYRANRLKEPIFSGLYYYEKILSDPAIWERLQTTAKLVAFSVTGQLVVGFLLALLFEKEFPGRRILMVLVLTPMMLSMAAVGAFFKLFYDPTFGLVSQVSRFFTGDPVAVLTSADSAIFAIAIADIWMWSPFVMLLVLAGLVSVPAHLYEAAEIDRASWFRRFRTITFPYIRALLLLAILFRTIETFKLFDLVYIMTEGGPGSATETISVYVYRVAFQHFKTSEASALAYLVLFMVIVLTNLYLYFVNQRDRQVAP
ncbi:MAG: carbohydrate ABC transporter permease [Alphaproteobacteria bacterium]